MTLSPAQVAALKWLSTKVTVTRVLLNGREDSVLGPSVGTLRALERKGLAVGEASTPTISRTVRHFVQWRLTDTGREANRE